MARPGQPCPALARGRGRGKPRLSWRGATTVLPLDVGTGKRSGRATAFDWRSRMAITKATMTDEQRKSVALEYLKAFDNGGVTSTGAGILDLFASDAQVYFPKWGLA